MDEEMSNSVLHSESQGHFDTNEAAHVIESGSVTERGEEDIDLLEMWLAVWGSRSP